MTTLETPAAARTLLRQLDSWSVAGPVHATGPCTFTGLSETEDGHGKRKRIELVELVESVLIRACHVDGRALVALWIRRPSRRGWSLDTCWRGRHPGEYTPRPMTATQLKAYVAAPDAGAALVAIEPAQKEEAA